MNVRCVSGAVAAATVLLAAQIVPAAFGSALVGSAAAASSCPDYTVLGVAGSGEGDEDGGLGATVSRVANGFAARARADGHSATVRAVRYPALPMPTDLDGLGPFLASINTGAADTEGDFNSVVAECPSTKFVLVGFSQGAAAVHRALQSLGDRRQIAAAALVADPDRLPGDTTVNIGTGIGGQGMARAAVVAGAVPGALPPRLGARTVSVCTNGDPVCQWTGNLGAIVPNSHDSYTPGPILARLDPLAGL